ncbi:filamentous hemagglutinin N-terminal domain-containing protein [Variovorax sp. J22G21]|uniref:two-partner secretion domain-containing protein n=1 Tax=Variovorax fucosicus TaxID=3053517 RepID=UPI00257518BF|nr:MULTISPECIES: filamentous hemagglutinin N-terminal domain-containing protein [unclassified Variovorax]MDM0039695.1 filamentous hemagglutinin N-terminal domain-containing protein [Variovorax sp. J22R193]MDM0064470.1 filamentous hemagglutinin N-terminal domain-containing protein [Variovorax sp. J22G21]
MKNRPSATAPHRLRLRPLALSLACIGLAPAGAQVLPSWNNYAVPLNGGTVTVGTPANLPGGGQQLGINQSSLRAIINWQSFSIGAKDQVNINQQLGASSVLLNRVVNSGPRSEIAGLLTAPGRVYVINPAGVLFGPTAQVNVGGLVASTLDIAGSDQDARNATFMAGGVLNPLTGARELSFAGPANGVGEVTVEAGARLTATGVEGRNGVIALMGATVVNRGEINVARGSAGLLAGNQVVVIDPVGDGLTTFRIPTTNSADNARVDNVVDAKAPEGAVSGRIMADGGLIALMAGSANPGATVVNQQGTLQARSLQNRNGEIVLAGLGSGTAHNVVAVGGTLDVSGSGAGTSGGTIKVEGDMLRIQDANLRAGGAVGTANGQVQIVSNADLLVQAADSNPEVDGTSTVAAQVIGQSLGRGADVTLTSRAAKVGGVGGWGVTFDNNAQVVKNEGGNARLAVNSNRNIEMRAGSAIQSKAGALAVDFNADAAGSLASDPVAVGAVPARGAIVLQDATIETNGGNIRFYGQSDAVNGRAVSGQVQEFPVDLDPIVRQTAGIEVNRSTLSTCGVAEASCTGGGSISLRGEGASWQFTQQIAGEDVLDIDGRSGVSIQGSNLRSGSGAITLQGRGGFGIFSAGVETGSFYDGETFTDSRIASASGNVSIIGSGSKWNAGDPVGASMDAGVGVAMGSTTIVTGGNVSISGTGGDISGVTTDAQFLALAAKVPTGSFHAEGTGVDIDGVDITAGKGKSITITGSAGSQAFFVSKDAGGAPVLDLDFTPASAVSISGAHIVAESGRIAIQGGTGTVDLDACCSSSTPENPGLLLSTASTTGPGGAIDISGRNVRVQGYNSEGVSYARLDASGAGQAGTLDIRAVAADGVANSGVLGIDFNVAMTANALSPTGNGGSIRVLGDNTLRAYGSFEAKGGSAGGNGGFVETSGGAFDLTGVRVNTSAPGGKAGNWLIDPYNVDIVSGIATGSLTGNPFAPLADSVIQDGDINAALVNGDVTITTGVGGPPLQGDITFDDANILYTGAAGRTFRLDAHRSIRANGGTTISAYTPLGQPTAGALNVVFNADANGGGLATGGGQVSYSGQIYTNGGNVVMNGAWANPASSGCSICLDGPLIDTRAGNTELVLNSGVFTGGSNLAAGGNVQLTGRTIGPGTAAQVLAGVDINGTRISTSTGNVGILGSSTIASGVVIESVGPGSGGGIFTTSGSIAITGIGSYTPNSTTGPGHGVVVGGTTFATTGAPTLQTTSGNIDISGVRLAGGPVSGNGVLLAGRSLVATTGGGNITVTGESQGNGAGVLIQPELNGTFGTIASGQIVGSNNVVLRASNDGSTDALVIGARTTGATVSAASVLNLRPGGLNVAGTPDAYAATAVDRTANAITLGGAASLGFAVSAAELARLSAPTLVAGSNAHAGNIDVVGPLALGSALTLQNGGGGNITLGAPVSATQLGLVSAGNITQAAGANIAAGTLLARSSGGSVLLGNAGNDVAVVAGGAAGRFEYVDANALTLGSASVIGYDAAGNLPQLLSATSMSADTVFVRTLSQDLSLNGSVSSTSGADLVAAGRFQNLGPNTMSGAPWRIWADTWVGESRGGVAGSGLLPNLYHCAYLGLCTVTVSPGDNHFIYAQQPVATVFANSATRPFGFPNPFFTYSISGLILGDTGVSFNGVLSTTAGLYSLPGFYPINGSFSSAAGYAVNVVPGTLRVSAALDLPKVDVLRDLPTTYLYDRNIGQAPICLATGPLDGDRSQQGGDVLAREWSRVRSRPNLLNCVDTERKNGCADF